MANPGARVTTGKGSQSEEVEVLIAVLFAVAAGASFAVANLVQQRAARSERSGPFSPRLVLGLLRNRTWLIGLGLVATSYGFQSVALSFGPLSLVQSIMVSEILFAAPVSARLHDQRVGPRLWLGIVAVAVGLPLALVTASPRGGNPAASEREWLLTVAAVAVVAAFGVSARRLLHGVARASALAFAGAVVMGCQSALLDVSLVHLREGAVAVVTSWQSYLLVVASLLGGWLIQGAYRDGPLAASLPMLDAGEPTVAVLIGVLLFGEQLQTGPVRLPLTVLGLTLIVVGIVTVDTSPTAQRVAREEQRENAEGRQQPDAVAR
jgi:drug/metabolite transporter (DMT)-like permease